MRSACAKILAAVVGLSLPGALALGLSLPGAGCKRSQDASSEREAERASELQPLTHAAPDRQRIVITDIAVHTVDPPVAREIYPRQLARQLGRALVTTDRFAATVEHVPEGYEARPASLEVRIHYDVVESGSAGAPAAVLGVEGTLAWEEPAARDPAPWDRLAIERFVHDAENAPDHDELVAALASDAVDRLAERLAERERVRAGGDAAVTAALAEPDPDPSAVLWAMDLVAHHRLRGLFDQVAAKLESDVVDVRHQAVLTLAALDPGRAVGAITRRVRFDDTETLTAVIDAVALLGGEDARAYLEFVASGHPEDTIRERARAAAARLQPAP